MQGHELSLLRIETRSKTVENIAEGINIKYHLMF
jgi:hypothetical protein